MATCRVMLQQRSSSIYVNQLFFAPWKLAPELSASRLVVKHASEAQWVGAKWRSTNLLHVIALQQ